MTMALPHRGLRSFLAAVASIGLMVSPAGAQDAPPETFVAASAQEFAVAEASCPTGMAIDEVFFHVSLLVLC
jgi:hypothetical protein